MAAEKLDPFVRAVARRIAALRVEAALTQEALAVRLGIATKNLQRLESGRQNLTLLTLSRVARALGVPPAELVVPTRPALTRRGARRSNTVPFTRVLGPTTGRRAVPLLSLRGATSAFGLGEAVEMEDWVSPRSRQQLSPGMFVALVEGDAMEPTIPAECFVLFQSPVLGPLEGRVLLVQVRSPAEPENGGTLVVRRVTALRPLPDGGCKLRLAADHAHPIDVETGDGTEVRFVAEVVETLGPL